MNKILVVGSLNMDFLIEVENAPSGGETILGDTCSWSPGGKGANQAFTAGRLLGNVSMIGAVGNDVYGQALKNNLNQAGVNVEGVEILDGHPTGMAFVLLDRTGENRIIVISGANSKLTQEMVEHHIGLLEKCDVVVMQMEIPLDVITYVASKAKEMGKFVILDPAPAPDPEKIPEGFFEKVDLIKPNETELEKLTGMKVDSLEELERAAQVLLRRGVETVVITRGEKGSVIVTRDSFDEIPAQKVKAVDTTAAGDCFTAALALKLKSNNMREAVEFASRVASKAVQKKGAQNSVPTLEEVME